MSEHRIWLGWDPNEMQAYNVAERSARANSSVRLDIKRLALINLKGQGLYHRPTERRNGQLWDVISEAPMSTEHAISRFLVPHLSEYHGWALFMDGDVLVRGDLAELFALADPKYAVMVVKHEECVSGAYKTNVMNGDHGVGPDGYLAHSECDECRYVLKSRNLEVSTKKDGHAQSRYPRKNWSSVMLFNCSHPAHKFLTTSSLNLLPGRDLHRFCWLGDHEIGSLPVEWNHLVGVSAPTKNRVELAHFTLGTPNVSGHEHDDFAEEWLAVSKRCGYRQQEAVGGRR